MYVKLTIRVTDQRGGVTEITHDMPQLPISVDKRAEFAFVAIGALAATVAQTAKSHSSEDK